jgi:YD repeat-containing protein
VFTYPFIPPQDLDYKRGLLLSEKVYDNTDKILKEVNYLDSNGEPNYDFVEETLALSYNLYDLDCKWTRFYEYYSNYNSQNAVENNYLKQCFGSNGCNSDCFGGIYQNCYNGDAPYYFENNNVKSTWAKLKGTTTKEYFYSGSTQTIVETTTNYTYNDDNFQIAEQEQTINDSNDTYLTKYFYPVSTNIPSSYQGSQTSITRLNQLNKVNEVLVSEQYKNGVKRSQSHTLYFEPITDLVMPQTIKVSKDNDPLEDRVIYYKYDSYGNPQEVSQADGTKIVYVWGYNGQFPIAKVENSTYGALPTLKRDEMIALSDDPNATEQQLLTKMQEFRDFINTSVQPDRMVTTMTYKPLIGVSTMTDPRGYTMSYEYDDLNRLKYVRDADGNIVSKNQYNYKN